MGCACSRRLKASDSHIGKVFQVREEIFSDQLSGEKVLYYLCIGGSDNFFFIILDKKLPFTNIVDKTSEISPIQGDAYPFKVSEEFYQEFLKEKSFVLAFEGKWKDFSPQAPKYSLLDLMRGKKKMNRYKSFTLEKANKKWEKDEYDLEGCKVFDQHGFEIWIHEPNAQAAKSSIKEVEGKIHKIFLHKKELEKRLEEKKQELGKLGNEVESLGKLVLSVNSHLNFWKSALKHIKAKTVDTLSNKTINSWGMGPTDGVRNKLKKYQNPTSSLNVTLQAKKKTKNISQIERDYLFLQNLKEELSYCISMLEQSINKLENSEFEKQLNEGHKFMRNNTDLNTFNKKYSKSEKLKFICDVLNLYRVDNIQQKQPQLDAKVEIEYYKSISKIFEENIAIEDYKIYKKLEKFRKINLALSQSKKNGMELLKRFTVEGSTLIGRIKSERDKIGRKDKAHILMRE